MYRVMEDFDLSDSNSFFGRFKNIKDENIELISFENQNGNKSDLEIDSESDSESDSD